MVVVVWVFLFGFSGEGGGVGPFVGFSGGVGAVDCAVAPGAAESV